MDVTSLSVVVVVVLAVAVCGVAAVMRLHWRAFRRLPAAASLTPLHVAVVSAGVLIWGVTLAWALLDNLSAPATPARTVRLVLYGLGALLIVAALVIIGGLQRRRVRFAPPVTRVTVTEVEQVSVDESAPIPLRPAPPSR